MIQNKGKFGPQFIGPFRVIDKVGKVDYRLELSDELSQLHTTFQISKLQKCLMDVTVILSLDDIQLDKQLNYVERSIMILDRKMKTLRNKVLPLVKVEWQHQKGFEWTWELVSEVREHYAKLLTSADFEDEV